MSLLLRKLENVRYWDVDPHDDEAWLPAGQIRADAVVNVETDDNEFSIYQVGEDEDLLFRAIAALAAGSQSIKDFHYALFDRKILSGLKICLTPSIGTTIDQKVNEVHADLTKFSALELVRFCEVVIPNCVRKEHLPAKRVLELVAHSVQNGFIPEKYLQPSVKKNVSEYLATKAS